MGMTLADLIKFIAGNEGKKSNVKVGDIREIVGILSDLLYDISTEEDGDYYLEEFTRTLVLNGKRRKKNKKV